MSANAYLTNLRAVEHDSAVGLQRDVLDTAMKQVGFIPNMYANMVNAPAVLSTYLHGYKLFRDESGLTATEQEVVFLAVSQVNGCDYCVAAHSMIADKVSGVPKVVLHAIREQRPIPDEKLSTLYRTVEEMVRTHGQPSTESVRAFLQAGYAERDFLYIILAIAVKTLSNFSNHAFGTAVDDRFAAYKVA